MPPANIETDPFFVLLTDALRSGPGSQPWQAAIAHLRSQGLEGTDEHRLLVETRQNLESGREYRSVRAGPGFTRKIMAGIENESTGSKRKGVPTATVVAILCGVLILSAVGYVVWRMSSPPINDQSLISELENKSQGFVDRVASATFAGSIPDGWHAIGSLPLDESDGLRPNPKAGDETKVLGGGLVLKNPQPAVKDFAVDLTVIDPAPSTSVLLEAFVTTDSKFSEEKGTSSKDLVWQLRGKDENVLVAGSGKIGDAPPVFHSGDTIRLIVGLDMAIIETVPSAGGKPQRLWAGRHELGHDPRYVGVRFLQTGAGGKSDVKVQQIKVTTAPG